MSSSRELVDPAPLLRELGSGIEMSGVTYAGMSEHVEITPDGNVQVMTTSWHEGSPYSCARPGCPAGCDRNDPTTEAPWIREASHD